MKKIHFLIWISIALSIIAIIMAFLSIDKIEIEGANLLGWLVGILAILVTTLITWQIYTLIDIRKIRDEMRQQKEDAFLKATASLVLTFLAISDYYYSILSGNDQPENKKLYKYIYNRVSSIVHASRINDFETCRVVIKVLKETIRPENISMSENEGKSLFDLLSGVSNAQLIEGFSDLLVLLAQINVKKKQ